VKDLSLPSGKLEVESLAELDNPWAMAYLPDERLLITEKPGNPRILADGKLSDPPGGIPKVEYHDQGGLLDVAVETPTSQTTASSICPTPRLPKSSRPMPAKRRTRTSGDRQRFEPAQDMKSNLGKIVRIKPDGSIPEDNPFVNQEGARADIWSLGHRNELGAAFRPGTFELRVHEMAPKGGDELNRIDKGKNYGWPIVSEGKHYDDADIPNHSEKPEFRKPDIAWVPSISPAALIFYTGDKIKDWKGKAILGGLSSEAVIVVSFDRSKVAGAEVIKMGKRIREVAPGPRRRLAAASRWRQRRRSLAA
jgi:glucose/arabinose dehydrogenase